MNDWQLLRWTHPLGSPLKGTVVADDDRRARLLVETSSTLQAELPYAALAADSSAGRPVLPAPGQQIATVVANIVHGVLILSARAEDLRPERIAAWSAYYAFIDTLELGCLVTGRVGRVMPYGLFVELGYPYPGLIDIGHASFNQGVQLPHDRSLWPALGETIRCRLSYLRLHGQQLGLGWVPA